VIILDTHTWVWWVSSPEKLSAPARERIEKAVISKNIFISSISAITVVSTLDTGFAIFDKAGFGAMTILNTLQLYHNYAC